MVAPIHSLWPYDHMSGRSTLDLLWCSQSCEHNSWCFCRFLAKITHSNECFYLMTTAKKAKKSHLCCLGASTYHHNNLTTIIPGTVMVIIWGLPALKRKHLEVSFQEAETVVCKGRECNSWRSMQGGPRAAFQETACLWQNTQFFSQTLPPQDKSWLLKFWNLKKKKELQLFPPVQAIPSIPFLFLSLVHIALVCEWTMWTLFWA